jgi:acyl-coenzyme A thioesterase PaaI-like protein
MTTKTPRLHDATPSGTAASDTASSDSPLIRLAAALRRVSAVVVGKSLSDDEIAAAADELSVLATRLESVAPPARRTLDQVPDPDGHPQSFFPTSPVIGLANPISPPVEVWSVVDDEGQREIRGRASFDYPYEGPPTCVHGGVIAELFDELLGLANLVVGQAAMTGTLKIRYHRPTPLLAPLDLVARFTGKEGRKVFCWGAIVHEGETTAEADGIFVEVPAGRMLDIVSNNARSAEAPLLDPNWQRMVGRTE